MQLIKGTTELTKAVTEANGDKSEGQSCSTCGNSLKQTKLHAKAKVYCPFCGFRSAIKDYATDANAALELWTNGIDVERIGDCGKHQWRGYWNSKDDDSITARTFQIAICLAYLRNEGIDVTYEE